MPTPKAIMIRVEFDYQRSDGDVRGYVAKAFDASDDDREVIAEAFEPQVPGDLYDFIQVRAIRAVLRKLGEAPTSELAELQAKVDLRELATIIIERR